MQRIIEQRTFILWLIFVNHNFQRISHLFTSSIDMAWQRVTSIIVNFGITIFPEWLPHPSSKLPLLMRILWLNYEAQNDEAWKKKSFLRWKDRKIREILSFIKLAVLLHKTNKKLDTICFVLVYCCSFWKRARNMFRISWNKGLQVRTFKCSSSNRRNQFKNYDRFKYIATSKYFAWNESEKLEIEMDFDRLHPQNVINSIALTESRIMKISVQSIREWCLSN
mgnify:CR=1 FL=1